MNSCLFIANFSSLNSTYAIKEETDALESLNVVETEDINSYQNKNIINSIDAAESKIEEITDSTTTATTSIVGDIDKIIDAINRLIYSLDRVAGITPVEDIEKYWNDVLVEYSKLQTKTGKFSMAKTVDPTAFNEAMYKYIQIGGTNTFDMLPGAEGKFIDEKSLTNISAKFEEFKSKQEDVKKEVL